MARDYKGFGTQSMNAVMELPPPQEIRDCDGICFHRGKEFQGGAMKGLSRTIDTQAKNGVVIWKK